MIKTYTFDYDGEAEVIFKDLKKMAIDADKDLKNKLSNKKIRLVTPDNWLGKEEWYLPVIECPKCKHKLPARHTNFCSGCGVELKLSTSVQKLIKGS
jgi:rRNA maturation endonuclease Nob1